MSSRSAATLPALLVLLSSGSPLAAAEPAAGIEGTVADDGRAVAGALVAAVTTSGEIARTARSDAQGHFRLAPLPPGRYGVTATAKGHTAGLTLGVEVAAARVTSADIRLGGDSIIVRGTVLDDASAKPLADATLNASRISPLEGDVFAVELDHGAFTVQLPRASYVFTARAPGKNERRRTLHDAPTEPLELRLRAPWPNGPAPKEVADWLRTHAVALDTVEAGHGFDDLQPLAAVIGDARVVGLGEATHGTREFFQLKHRLVEWLVVERGFTAFAIEATMPEAFELNDYVLTGRGDPQQLLAGLGFWTWDTEEVLALVRWMRHWNEDPAHPRVRFYGFDMQYAPRAREGALRYVARVAPTEAKRLGEPLSLFRYALDVKTFALLDAGARAQLVTAAQALVDRFDAARDEWIARSSADEWAVARQLARVLVQSIANDQPDADGGLRDRFMAENLRWIVEHEGPRGKVVAWAHNFHIGRFDDGFRTMGSHLSEALGAAYLPIGFAFDHGSFQARDVDKESLLHGFEVPPMPVGSFDATLAAAGLPRLLVDLRHPPAGVVATWLRAEHGHREFGSAFSTAWPQAKAGSMSSLAPTYDVAAFVAETTAARPLSEGTGGDSTVYPALANLGFEDSDGDRPRAWQHSPMQTTYTLTASPAHAFAGRRCGLLSRKSPVLHDGAYGVFEQHVDATPFRGQRLHLTAAVRAQVPLGSSVRLYVLVEEKWRLVGANTMRDRPIVRPGWHDVELEVAVPANATSMWIGAALFGSGSACFDEFRLRGEPQ